MLKIAALIVLALVAGVLVYAATLPDQFRIERSTLISAAPEKIFPHLVNFRQWTAWSPWENVDPALKRTYGGPESGVGAHYAWEGNRNVGSGRMEIREVRPAERIAIQLDFFSPMEAHNTAEFTLAKEGAGTKVTWAMFGPSPYVSKLMGLFFNMDRMVGGMFAQGLANLKTVAEK